MIEIKEQRAIMRWVLENRVIYPALKWLAHIPNEGGYIRGVGPATESIGINDGVPDFVLPIRASGYSGLWIELKRPHEKRVGAKKAVSRGRVKPNQREWQDHLNSEGYLSLICYGAEEAVEAIKGYIGIKDDQKKHSVTT